MKELLKKIALYGAISSFAFVLAMPAMAEDRTDGKYRVGDDNGNSTACTMDAKQCPDGTYVGRTGEDCEFVCPGVVTNDNDGDGTNGSVGSTSPAMPPVLYKGEENGNGRKGIIEALKNQIEKAREDFKNQREEAKKEFEHAREEYKNKVEEVKQDKKEFSDSVKEDKKNHSEESREKVVEKAHSMIDNTIGAMVNRLEALKNKVNGVKLLDADRAEIVAEINKEILWLNTKSTELQNVASSTAVTASTTAQEIKTKSKEVKAYWDSTVKVAIKRISGELLVGRLNYIVNKEDELAGKLTTDLAAIKAKGVDVVQLEQDLADAKTKIVTVKAKIAEAKAKFKTIVSADTSKSIYEEGKNIIDDAKDATKEIHKLLIKVSNSVNALSGVPVTVTGTATTTATTTTP